MKSGGVYSSSLSDGGSAAGDSQKGTLKGRRQSFLQDTLLLSPCLEA